MTLTIDQGNANYQKVYSPLDQADIDTLYEKLVETDIIQIGVALPYPKNSQPKKDTFKVAANEFLGLKEVNIQISKQNLKL